MRTHERDIPGLATQATTSSVEFCSTELSFCLPTSLAFAKRLTWEQTPWIDSVVHQKTANPINTADAHTIAHSLRSHLGKHTITITQAIQNALFFGSTICPVPDDEPATPTTYPHLFVVFPHAKGNISRNTTFLRIWHDDIVKPAFDRAWKDSGLTPIYGAEPDGQTRILPPRGTYTAQDALPAKRILERLRNGRHNNNTNSAAAVRAYWPAWRDDWGMGTEGRYSGLRARIYDEAWDAICGMVKGHPGLADFQDPVLLAVCRAKVYVAPELSVQSKFRGVGQEWDKFVDARYVKQGSFKIVFQTMLGVGREEGDAFPGQALSSSSSSDSSGPNFKRTSEEGKEDADTVAVADRHRDKRARRAGVYRNVETGLDSL